MQQRAKRIGEVAIAMDEKETSFMSLVGDGTATSPMSSSVPT